MIASCDLVNAPVKEFFKEYTENAAIEQMTINGNFVSNPKGVDCLTSDSDVTVDFFMRNPQKYTLKFDYVFEDAATSSEAASFPVTYDQSADKAYVTFKFQKDFLKAVDSNNKNLNGKIIITESNTGRRFPDYPVTLNADTTPPAIESSCFQRTTDPESGSSGQYILCMNFPATEGTVHEKDTHIFNIGGETYYFNKSTTTSVGFFTDPELQNLSSAKITTVKPEFYPLTPTGIKFNTDESGNYITKPGFIPVYYMTGVDITEGTSISRYVSITDNAGLTSGVTISDSIQKLSSPVFEIAGTKCADELNAVYNYKITHSGLDTKGDPVAGTINIGYTVTKGGLLYSSGTIPSGGTISLAYGKDYKITAFAKKAGCIDSDSNSSSTINVSHNPVYYVKQDGDDDNGLGSYNKPLRTLKKCKEVLMSEISYYGLDVSGYTFNLLSDIKATFVSDYDDESMIYIMASGSPFDKDSESTQLLLTIKGYNGVKKIDPNVAELNPEKVAIINADHHYRLTLKDLVLTGGRGKASTGHTSGIHAASREGYSYNKLVMDNVILENCKNGRTTYIDCATFEMKNSTIRNNDSNGTPSAAASAGLYCSSQCSATITNSSISGNIEQGATVSTYEYVAGARFDSFVSLENVTVTGNKFILQAGASTVKKHPGIYADPSKTIFLTGKNLITGNVFVDSEENEIKENFYLKKIGSSQGVITITGPLTGSKIGVTTEVSPTMSTPVKFTENYSSDNSAGPGIYFESDKDYGAALVQDEAAFSIGGGTLGDVLTSQSMTFACTETAFYPGLASEISITPTLKMYETEIASTNDIWSSVSWSTWLIQDENEVSESRTNGTGYSIKANIPASVVFEENYVIHVKATLNGVSYDENFRIKGSKNIEDFSTPTKAATYSITSSNGLEKMAQLVNSGKITSSYKFELASNVSWTSTVEIIGTSTNPFNATFDGKGYSITGINISTTSLRAGLFGYTKNAVIKNLTVTGSITNSSSSSYTAGLIGQSVNSNIINCVNEVTVTSNYGNASGIVGIFADTEGSLVDSCINKGSITAQNEAAGIAGSGGNNSIIRNCGNTGTIQTTGSACIAAGIKTVHSGTIENCYNYGDVEGNTGSTGAIGGLVGNGSSTCILTNSISNGKINILSGTKKGGNISGNNSIDSSAVNYFSYPSDTTCKKALGGSTETNSDKTYEYAVNGGQSTAVSLTNITVGSYTGKDIVNLLNAWIDAKGADASSYKRWKYNEEGNPVFE